MLIRMMIYGKRNQMPPQTNSNLEQRYATNCHGTVGLRHSYLSYHPMLAFPRDDDIVDDYGDNHKKDNNDGDDNCVDDLDGDDNNA